MSPSWYSIDDMPFTVMVSELLHSGSASTRIDVRQWPDVRLYFPPLIRSVMGNGDCERLLVRVDYGLVPNDTASAFPSLHSIGVGSGVDNARARGLQEVIVRYWLASTASPL